MKFSTKTEYGMRAMVQIGKKYGQEPVSLATIAKDEKISQPYLERLVARLKADGLVKSTKGVKGGYELSRRPDDVSLFEVVEALEGPIAVFSCLMDNTKMICTRKSCLTKKVWIRLQDEIIKVLRNTKLSELI